MKTIIRIFKWTLLGLVIIIVGFALWTVIVAVDHPPVVKDMSCLNTERQKVNDSTYYLGNNWLRKSESGIWEMYIEGNAFERGVAFGKLTKELLYYQENAFFEQIRKLVPSENYLKFLKYFVAWFNRNLDKNITEEYKEEIFGTSFSCAPEFNFIGSPYQRQLNYHAAHDIGHALQGMMMVGCTSFSCWDSKSADSSLIIGRNFDFYAGNKFAENKIVCFVNPTEGFRFMMVTWADMLGVVSGMNEKGLTVTINASKSSLPLQASTPISLLSREILQYASTIDQAYAIAKKRKLFVSESLLIGSAIDGKSAIIEKSPRKYDIVYPTWDYIVCANHFQGEAFKDDEINIRNIEGSDSYSRFLRAEELIKADSVLDVDKAIAILRNMKGVGNKELGTGNPMAINQLISHHAVVFKPQQLLAWVSAAPYQIGTFEAYDLRKVFSLNKEDIIAGKEIYTPELTVPADSFLLSEQYSSYKRYLLMTNDLKNFTSARKILPDSFENSYILSNPDFYAVYSNLADYYSVMKNNRKALEYYNKALSKEIPGNDLRNKLTSLSEKLKN
jgi:hypothetical protein